ncbi:hypothetical protein [Nocardia sp. NPDC051833]|uniref:hypothetical protein n=1 Tax=Nocardia sp. NPDC051833 TaxID=3155674 RepID=UPI003444F8FE
MRFEITREIDPSDNSTHFLQPPRIGPSDAAKWARADTRQVTDRTPDIRQRGTKPVGHQTDRAFGTVPE